MTGSAPTKVRPTEPWRQRLIRSLLYGRNVDRAAKARARVGELGARHGASLRRSTQAASARKPLWAPWWIAVWNAMLAA